MATFSFIDRSINLPAVEVSKKEQTSDIKSWMGQVYKTIQLTAPISALRVHTNGKEYPNRPRSEAVGRWILIGDVIQNSSELADSRSLPTKDPKSMTAFTHTSEAVVFSNSILNIGVASSLFGGRGGGFQAEFIKGPDIQYTPLAGKHWHKKTGNA